MTKHTRWLLAILTALVIVGSVAFRLFRAIHADTAHFLAIAKMLADGRSLYDDVLDQNTPAIIALGLLAVRVSRATGVPLDQANTLVVTMLVGLALWLASRAVDDRFRSWWILAVACTLYALSALYGSREHLLVVCALPHLLYVVRNAHPTRLDTALIVGLASFGYFLKPHFAAFWGAAVVFEAWHRRRVSRPTAAIGAALAGLYVVFFALKPAYLHTVMPLVLATFRHYQIGFWPAVFRVPFALAWVAGVIAVGTVLAVMLRHPFLLRVSQLGWVLFAANVVIIGVQGFGFPYHAMPIELFGYLLAAAIVVAGRSGVAAARPRGLRIVAAVGLGAVITVTGAVAARTMYRQQFGATRDAFASHAIVRLLNENGPSRSVFIFSSSVSPGGLAHVYGHTSWAGHMTTMFLLPIIGDVSENPLLYPHVDRATLSNVETFERRQILDAFRTRHPDLVLVDVGVSKIYFKTRNFDYLAFLFKDPAFEAAWQSLGYQAAGVVNDFFGQPFAVFRRARR